MSSILLVDVPASMASVLVVLKTLSVSKGNKLSFVLYGWIALVFIVHMQRGICLDNAYTKTRLGLIYTGDPDSVHLVIGGYK